MPPLQGQRRPRLVLALVLTTATMVGGSRSGAAAVLKIDRTVSAAAPASIDLQPQAGEVVVCRVDQLGVDVVLSLKSDANELLHIDDTKQPDGSETLDWIAADSNTLHLLVTPSDKTKKGRIGGECETRPSTAADQARVQGRASMRQADKLLDEGTADSIKAALPLYKSAVEDFTKAGDQRLLGIALDSTGWTYDQLFEKKDALDWYERALIARRAAHDRNGEALTLQGIGLVHLYRGDYDRALEVNNEVLAIARTTGDRSREAGVLHNIGGIYWSTDEMQRSLSYYEQALKIEKQVGDRSMLASTYNNLGDVYRRLGDNEVARGYFERSLKSRQELKNRRGEAHSLHTLGLVWFDEGNTKKALELFTRALTMRQELGDKRGIAFSLGGSGAANLRLGNKEKALQFQLQALEMWKSLGEARSEAETREAVGEALAGNDRLPEAISYFQEAIPKAAELRDHTTEANARLGLARAFRKQGKLDEAQDQIERAIAIVDDLRGRLANLELRTSYFSSVKKFYDFYIELLMERHAAEPTAGYDRRAFEASEASRARTLLDTLAAGGVELRRGVDPAVAQRETALLRELHLKQKQLGRLAESKSPQSEVDLVVADVARLQKEHDALVEQIRLGNPDFSSLINADPATVAQLQPLLGDDTVLLEYRLGETHSDLWMLGRSTFRSMTLPGRAALERDALALHDAIEARNHAPKNESAEKRALRVKNADLEVDRLARKLGTTLLPRELPSGVQRVAVSPDGALQYIPFSLLRNSSGARWIEKREIVSLPNASMLVAFRNRSGKKRSSAVAVFADPVFESSDPRVGGTAKGASPAADPSSVLRSGSGESLKTLPRLRFSREEADAIRGAMKGDVLEALDFKATKQLMASAAMKNYGTLHFATHGILDSRKPELSGLVLSLVDEKGRRRDGFVSLREIYDLDLSADLVVLSACETALGKDVKGEGLIGLTRGFMYAGAPRVIASLWRVDDRATAKLMKLFYEESSRGASPSVALRRAQRSLAADPRWNQPYYWASFQLQGDWR